jgi:hypothetical protein
VASTSASPATAWLVARAARLRLAEPVARLIAGSIRSLHQSGHAAAVEVLALDKTGLLEDLQASLVPTGRANIQVLDRGLIKAMARAFIPEEVTDNYYLSDEPHLIAAKAAYRDFLARVWRRLSMLRRIDGVVSANFAYFAERELHAVLEEAGVPFLVMHKENTKTPGRLDFWRQVYGGRRGPFDGRRILVYNEVEKRLQIDCRIAAPERISVTGMPRLDRLHHWRRENAGRPSSGPARVLFFYFGERTGLPFIPLFGRSIYRGEGGDIDPTLKDLNWHDLARDTAEAIRRLAVENPDIEVLVKGKKEHGKGQSLADRMAAGGPLPENLRLVTDGDPFELIVEADVVCGFVTTAMLEALAAGKPVVMPAFAEATDAAMAPYLMALPGVAELADGPWDLIAKLTAAARRRQAPAMELAPAVAAELQRWSGNADGAAGRRVAEVILAEIDGALAGASAAE